MKRKETFLRLIQFLKPYWTILALSLVFAAGSVALTLYAPILVGDAIDMIVGPGQVSFSSISPLLIQLAIVVAATALLQWAMALCNNRLVCNISSQLRQQSFSHLHQLPVGSLDQLPTGDAISRITADIDQISDGLLLGFSQLFTGVATILTTLGFMLSLHKGIALVVVILTPLSFFVAGFIAKYSFRYFQQQAKVRGQMTTLVEELVGNQKVVQAFCYQKQAESRFEQLNRSMQQCGMKAVFFSSLTNPCTRFVNGVVYAAVGIVGAFVALSGGISVGGLSCFLSYANQYTKPFNEISGVVTELQNALASAARVFDLMDSPAQEPDSPKAMELKNPTGQVALEHVFFSYTPEKPLLQNLNLSVEPGQHIAIVGPTGCGKTTLINLLMRFYEPTSGSITLSGEDIRHFTRDSLRAGWGMVLQDTWLSSGTIHENIAYGVPNASREQVIEAAKAAFAHSFIMRLPQGYDTPIGENGATLSAGQRQLLCIARVMLQRPSMLILDEATSSIDTRTEWKVQQAFDALMEGRTSFVVAHRLSTIQNADMILVMKDGIILEKGNHQQLLEREGFYWRLYSSQFAHQE